MFKPSRNTVLSYHPVLEKSSFFFLFLHNPNDLFIQKDFLFIYIPIVVCCKIVPSLFHLFFGCKLLFPPAQVIDPVRLPAAVNRMVKRMDRRLQSAAMPIQTAIGPNPHTRHR